MIKLTKPVKREVQAPGIRKPVVELIVYRFYAPEKFYFDTISEAAKEALAQLELSLSFPHMIMKGKETIWRFGGYGKIDSSLKELKNLMKKEGENEKRTLGDFIFGSLLDFWEGIPECPYCGERLPGNKSFCSDQCEYEFFREDDLVGKIEEKEGRD